MRQWQLQQAKARLSELLKRAEKEGPQEITVRGEPAVIVLALRDYEKLKAEETRPNLVDFLLNSPLAGLDIEFERDKSLAREEDLFGDED